MFVNLFETLKNNRSACTALVAAIVLPIAYTNCSTQMSFEATAESRIESLNQSGTIIINNGDEFTNKAGVTLGISHASADKMYITNDPTCETGGSWEPISSSKPWNLDALNRETSVYVKFSNDGMLAGDCLSDAIVHDDIPPVLSVVTPPPAYTNASDVSATLNSSDKGSGIGSASCAGSGASTSTDCTPSSFISKSPAEGSHAYDLVVIDRAGNRSQPQSLEFVVDRTVPTVAINLSPSKITNQTASEFRVSGNDALSGVDHYECRVGATASFSSLNFKNCATTINTTLASGAQRFEVRSVDRAGNISSVASYTWSIDQGAPTVQITKTPDAYSNVTRPSFEFVGTDDDGQIASYSCQIDSGTRASCTSPFTPSTALTQGSHTFSVIGVDQAGNASSPATYTWIVDTTNPTVTITSKPNSITNSKTASFTMTANDTYGIDVIECQVDGGGYKDCGTSETFANLADGNRKFDVRAKDRAGNVSSVVSHNWAIDTSKPSVTITSGPAAWIKVKATSIAFAVTDTNVATGLPAATLECKMNDEEFAACVSPKAYSSMSEGKYTFIVRATDAAGNVSNETKHTFGVDVTAPAINIGKQPLSTIYMGEVSEIAFTVSDAGSGVDTVRCGANGTLAACSDDFSTKLLNLPVGNHTFSIVALDKAGNESKSEIKWQISNKTRAVTQTVNIKRLTKLDVLVVIDNSGSMANEHKNMASRFGTFLDQLNGIDWQVGIVTTDVRAGSSTSNGKVTEHVKRDGKLVEFVSAPAVGEGEPTMSGQFVISSSMSATTARNWFANTIQMATNGSGDEQGVAASIRTIQRSTASDSISQRNAALFRSDAALAILVVTDADETNPKGTETQNKPETLINLVKTMWSAKPFSFHSIIVPVGDSVCKGKDGNESYGYNYVSISNLTGGILGTVCATDYGTQLSAIGKSTQELVSTIALECAPLDLNNDGKADIQITTANGTTAPSYTVEGMNLKFSKELPVGTTTVRYTCVASL